MKIRHENKLLLNEQLEQWMTDKTKIDWNELEKKTGLRGGR